MRAASWCSIYKALVLLLVVLIVMEYLFGTTIEYKRWGESVFTNNSTRPTETFHSPLLIPSLLRKRNESAPAAQSLVAGALLTTAAANVSNANNVSEPNTNNESPPSPSPPPLAHSSSVNDDGANATLGVSSSALHNVSDAPLLPLCPEMPPDLGNAVRVLKTGAPSVLELEQRFAWLEAGGHGRPAECRAPRKVAIVVPFRCRAEHLLLFLQHMHPFLRRQQIDYSIYVVEQDGRGPFNRAALMNVGFVEANKGAHYDCFIFHDVDLLPEDERNLYSCPEMPRHMSVAVDVFEYALPYREIFGGVSAISTKHFRMLNGFSNSFWGWGGEDDDMSNRIRYHNLYISRYPKTIAKYTMLAHKKEKANPDRYEALKSGKLKYNTDGLSNLQYTLLQRKANKLYTWLLVHVGPTR